MHFQPYDISMQPWLHKLFLKLITRSRFAFQEKSVFINVIPAQAGIH